MAALSVRFVKPRLVLAILLPWIATGCQVRQTGAMETAMAQGFQPAVSVGGKKDANPLPVDAENIRAGQQNFSHYCMVCHDLDGQNKGVPFADRMSPPVPMLNSGNVQRYTDGAIEVDYRSRHLSFGSAGFERYLER